MKHSIKVNSTGGFDIVDKDGNPLRWFIDVGDAATRLIQMYRPDLLPSTEVATQIEFISEVKTNVHNNLELQRDTLNKLIG